MYDYVIVGAGSAGCVLANRLSEDADVQVLLVEAGPPDTADFIHIPAAFSALFRTQHDWDHMTGWEPGAAEPPHLPPTRAHAGRVVVAQRDDLHARQPARLRRVARRRLHRLGLGRPAALLHPRRGQRARRERVPRRRRAAAGQRGAGPEPDVPGLPRGRRRDGPARQRRLQRRRAGRLRLVPGHPARRAPGQHGRRLPAPGRGAAEPHDRDLRAGAPGHSSTARARPVWSPSAPASCSSGAPSAR